MWWWMALGCVDGQTGDEPFLTEGPDDGIECLEPSRADDCPEQSEPFTPACFDPELPCDCPAPVDETCALEYPSLMGANQDPSLFQERPWATAWVWPDGATEETRYIVTLHGTGELAEKNFYWWYPRVQELRDGGYNVGLIALQYHDPEAASDTGYLSVNDIYLALDEVLADRVASGKAAPHGHIFHGFSRGSANQYGLAILDRQQNQWSTTFIADSGAWAPGTDPLPVVQDAMEDGDSTLLAGVSFYIYNGLQDHDPQQNGTYGQNQAAEVMQDLGASVERVEDTTGCHSAFLTGEDSDRAWAALIWAFAIDDECE